jgi:hypothetical protein
MKIFIYKFRSIKSNLVKKENRRTKKTSIKLQFDKNSIQQHELKISMKDIFIQKSWIINFFLSIMIIIPIGALIYAILKLGLKINFNSSSYFNYIALNILLFIIIWTTIAIPSSIKNIKKDYVVNLRGKGNWKIIDENKWTRFNNLLNISQKEEE